MADKFISSIIPLGDTETYYLKDKYAIASLQASGRTITATKRGGGTADVTITVSKSDVGLSNVENTKLSTWAGTSNITTLGTITTGTWNGSTIGASYLPTATANAKGIVQIGSGITVNNGTISVSAANLGLSNALHFIGITSTTLSDGATTTTLTAKSSGSLSKTTGFVAGDVVIDGDNSYEYVWTGTIWERLGPDGSYAISNHTHDISLTSGGTSTISLSANTAYTLTAGGKSVIFKTPADNNTDTKVTSAANHYTPSADTNSALSVDASSTTAATWNTTSLVTGVNIERDSKGHVTGLTVDSIKMPANPNSNTTYSLSGAYGTNNATWVNTLTPSSGSATTSTVPAMVGASASAAGKGGLVPVPAAGKQASFLRGDGTWVVPTNTTYTIATGDSNGQIKVTPSSGDAYNVSVKGLGDRAFDSTAYLPLAGGTMTGNLGINMHDTDKHIIFDYDGDGTPGASWRIAALGSGSGDTNYFIIQSGTSTQSATSWNNVIRLGQNTYDAAFGGNIYPLTNNTKTLGTSSLKWNNVYATTFTGALSGNATTATTLATGRKINGTSFNGSSDITTSSWGTARNISIADSDSTNTGTAVSVNGSAAVTLKLPSTIKASLTGTATKATAANLTTTTNGIAKYSNTTGTFANSNVIIDASNNLSVPANISATGNLSITGNTTLSGQTAAESVTAGSLMVTGAASFTNIPTAPTPAADSNDTSVATTAFVMNAFTANDAMVFKGVINANSALPADHKQGWTYRIGTAGTYANKVCEVGDIIICVTDGTAANNDHWAVIQNNIDGAVYKGTNAFTDAHVIVADSTAGKVKDSGFTIGKSVPSNAVFTDTNKYHKTGSWSGLTYTATAVNSADELKFTVPSASTSAAGAVQLSSATNSTSTTLAATASAVKAAYDLAASKTSNTGTVTQVTAGTGLSIGTTAGGNFTTSGTINHTNSVTAQTTQALYPIKIDAQGHISAYGTAVTSLPASDVSAWAKAANKPSYDFSEIGSKPTTLSGYGITDAKIANGVITLGGNSITPLTAHQSLAGYLPLAGGTMTGNINRYYNAASSDPIIKLNSNNQDAILWHIGHGTSATATPTNSYKLLYKGTGAAPNNYLQLIANNSSDVVAVQINENGNMTVGTTSTSVTINSLTASQAVVTDGNKKLVSRGIRNNTSAGPVGWTANATDITLITTNTLAYWNGYYSGTSSNLQYSKNGEIMGLGTAQTVSGTKTFSAIQKFTNTTDSTHSLDTAAAISTSGGISVAKQLSAKSVRIDNNQSSAGVQLIFNTTTNALDFIFV